MPYSKPSGGKRKGGLSAPIQQLSKPVPILPPVGVNQVDPLAEFPPLDAVFMFNMIADKYGTRVRTGYVHWSDAPFGAIGYPKTVIPYSGSTRSLDKLFAVFGHSICDVSTSGAAPTVLLNFAAITTNSGHGCWVDLTILGGFGIVYTDEDYGAYRYNEGTNLWVRTSAAEITNVDPATLVFCTLYQSRLWFVQRDTSDAWFLPVGSIIGAATKFTFGNKFKQGGTLQALYTWPVMDSGAGLSEYLVAVSSSGEVIVYTGIDPTADPTLYPTLAFRQVGSWFIGAVPVGRRIGGRFGGDLYLLSIYGLLPMSKVIQGQLAQVDTIELTRKISPAIKTLMASSFTTFGWEVKLIPNENSLMVMSPAVSGYPATQFVQQLNTQGWSVYQGIPIYTGEVWEGGFYFGSAITGNIYQFIGSADDVSIDGLTSVSISCSILGSFQDVQEPGLYHRAMFIRPVFLTTQQPTYTVEVRYDYNISEIFAPGTATIPTGVIWDVAVWDLGIWGGQFQEVEAPRGGKGMGRAMAVGLSLSTNSETYLIRYDVAFDTGGFL